MCKYEDAGAVSFALGIELLGSQLLRQDHSAL